MIHLNVATRPFYNERAVHALLLVVTLLVVGLTAFNVARIVTLSAEQGQLDSRAAQAESRAQEERRAADAIRRTLDAKELEAIAAAALEANGIINQRVFSWTDLFNRLETTLPPNVRMTSITPRVDRDGRLYVSMVAVGRRIEDVDAFMERLETSGTFADLLSRQQSVNQDGLLETTLDGRYLGGSGASAAKQDE
jgi:Tfp pilus assembly protein PilN